MKTYRCYRVNGYPRVEVIDGTRKRTLFSAPSLTVARLATEFDWGFSGSASDQLAIAVLMDIYDDKAVALKHYESVKWTFLATAPRSSVTITENQVRELTTSLSC